MVRQSACLMYTHMRSSPGELPWGEGVHRVSFSRCYRLAWKLSPVAQSRPFFYRPGHASRHQTRTLLPGCWVWGLQDLEICWGTSQNLAHRAKSAQGKGAWGEARGYGHAFLEPCPVGSYRTCPTPQPGAMTTCMRYRPLPPREFVRGQHPEFLLGPCHVGNLCLACTRIPDPQEEWVFSTSHSICTVYGQ